ncbi:MAG: hypothetical protein ACI9MR_000602 [Myxococcota bacterium]|jgi:hypothetical protein
MSPARLIRGVAAAVIGGLVLAAVGTSAHAIDLGDGMSLDITESLFADYHFVLDDPELPESAREGVVDFRNRLNIRFRFDRFTIGTRLDLAIFPDPPNDAYQNDFRPEELFITGRFGRFVVTLGDDFVSIGRGLALSLRKLDEVGFSTTLRGVHLQYRTPRFKFRVSTGLTNVVNVDSVEEKLVPDPNDFIVAARVDVQPFSALKVGVHAVDIERRHSELRSGVAGVFGDDDTGRINGTEFVRSTIFGVNVELPSIADIVTLYAEFDYLMNLERRDTLQGLRDVETDGYAFYGSAQGFFDDVTVLVEAKHYDRYDVSSTLHPDTAQTQGVTQTFSYIIPPTLERIDQRIQNNTDVTGLRTKVDYAIDKDNSAFLSAAWFGDAPAKEEFTLHTYGGFEHAGGTGTRILAQAGYRREDAPDADIVRLSMVHFDFDWFHVFSEHADLQFHISHEFRSTNIGAAALEDDYIEGTSYATINLPPKWSFTAQFEYLTSDEAKDNVFPGAFIQYRFTDASFVRVFVGRGKGGLKCSGGVCRVFPDFEGVKVETTLRF